MTGGGDELDDLLGAMKPRRSPSDALGDALGEPPAPPKPRISAGAALDDMIRARETTRDAGEALDDIISSSGARPRGEEQVDRAAARRKWTVMLSLALGALGFAGVMTDVVAVTQLVADSGAKALGYVYPIGGAGLFLIAIFQNRFIDRFDRRKVLAGLCGVYALFSAAVLLLFASSVPTSVPSAFGLLLADQLNFMLPLLIWTLAGDIFTAGQTVTVFPVMSRWLYGGQVLGFAVATGFGLIANEADFSLAWLLIVPLVVCAGVAVFTPRALREADVSAGHGRAESSREAAKQSFGLLKDLPAFKWLFIGSFAVMAAGAIIEFGFFDIVEITTSRPGELQAIYAGVFLGVIVIASILQAKVAGKALNRVGAGKMLQLLPLLTLAAAVVLAVGGAGEWMALAIASTVLWKLPRQSLDNNARQLAMATIPDEQRARFSNLINLVPVAVGYLVVAGPIGLARLADSHWLAPVIAAVLALLGVGAGRKVANTWDDTQLSYRLKRRKRLG